jgi:hypothetical protein
MRRKDKEVVFLEVAPAVKERLRRAAEVLSEKSPSEKRVDMADIGRAALIEKLDRLAKKHPEILAA